MGFINKIKNFFYDEEEIEEEVPKDKILPEKNSKKVKKKEMDEISERELFRSERTFNFPMDVEEDFSPVTNEIKKEEIVKTNTVVEHVYKPKKKEEIRKPYSYVKPKEKEVKKFKPTPVISPVYGILDENYKADEKLVKNSLEETKEFNMSRKVTFDEIHKKAFETPKKSIEDSSIEENKEENKSIFYNLNDDTNNEEYEEDIKITYNDVDYDEEDDDNVEQEEVIIPKMSKIKKEDDKETDNDILSETKEQDLFNLIDNMYNSEEEEE